MSDIDLLIAGAGITGLYLGWYYLSLFPDRNVVILEKSSRIGGRIRTGNYQGTYYEIGAGVVNSGNRLLLEIIRHFDLELKPLTSGFSYVSGFNRETLSYYEIMLTIAPVIVKLRLISMLIGDKASAQTTIERLAKSYLSSQETEYLLRYLPYYSEVFIENAYDGFRALDEFSPFRTIYLVKGGFEKLVNKIANSFIKKGGIILLNQPLHDFETKNKKISCLSLDKTFLTHQLVITINIMDLLRIPALRYIRSVIDRTRLNTEPLLRIYAVYPVDSSTGKVWFYNMDRIVTDLPLKLIIPINEKKGLVMISYTDGLYAKWWWPLVKQFDRDPAKLIEEIQSQVRQLFPDLDIPDPLWLEPYYWTDAGNFNKPNKEGLSGGEIYKLVNKCLSNNVKIVNNATGPNKNWVEGSLEIVQEYLQTILSTRGNVYVR